MNDLIARLDAWGQPAWIALMVAAFVIFTPIGLAILIYMIWSGRMGFGRNGARTQWQQRMAGTFERKMSAFGMQAKAYEPTGNAAFDEYRDETLRRLEEEAAEFTGFLEQLRMARDKQEFEQFMRERKTRKADATEDTRGAVPDTGFGGAQPA